MVVKVKHRAGALLICMLFFAVAGCDRGRQAVSEPTQPVELVVQTATPQPELINPVWTIFDEFTARVEPVCAELSAHESARALACSLAFEMQLQRLKQFFSLFRNLQHLGEGNWEGTLVGATLGSTYITTTSRGCNFSAALWDGTKIEGSVNGNVLRADWIYSETITPEPLSPEDGESAHRDTETRTVWHVFRSAVVSLKEGGASATLFWEDGHAGLLLQDGGAYFTQGRDRAVNLASLPNEWADWGYTGGAVHMYTP